MLEISLLEQDLHINQVARTKRTCRECRASEPNNTMIIFLSPQLSWREQRQPVGNVTGQEMKKPPPTGCFFVFLTGFKIECACVDMDKTETHFIDTLSSSCKYPQPADMEQH